MSDGDHFYVDGTVNEHNLSYWAPEQPRLIHQRPLQSQRVKVWCAVDSFLIIGPYFCKENGVRVIANLDRYIHILQTFFRPDL